MNQLLTNRVGKRQKKQGRGCLFLILGSLLALLATGIYILAVSWLSGKFIEARHGDEIAYAVMTVVRGSWTVVLFLFYAILALWYVAPTQAEVDRQNRKFHTEGELGGRPAKAMSRLTLWLITGGMILCVFFVGLFSINTYQLVTEDGIRTYCFVETNSYEWEDVSAYAVGFDDDAGLTVTFSFKNGKKFEILQGDSINAASSSFKETYSSTTHFAATLDERLMDPADDRPVPPRNISSTTYDRAVKFYRYSYENLWPHVARLIGYEEMDLAPDETAPETEAVTEGMTED